MGDNMIEFPGYFLTNALPDKHAVVSFAGSAAKYLFPVVASNEAFLQEQPMHLARLKVELDTILKVVAVRYPLDVRTAGNQFFDGLPAIKAMLLEDAKLIMEFDPAAHTLEEVIFSYPGFFAIMIHRMAHSLYRLNIPLVPRMIAEWSHGQTGIDINPGARIGCPFCIDHGTGIVIGETSQIGNSVKIYQGVTLGALAVRKEDASSKRHPTIEDNVIIYAGSTILGGKTVIGHDSIIGGNTWITESVKPFSVVYHKNQMLVSDRNEKSEPINFVI
jgi:serine O-acetyltransferase